MTLCPWEVAFHAAWGPSEPDSGAWTIRLGCAEVQRLLLELGHLQILVKAKGAVIVSRRPSGVHEHIHCLSCIPMQGHEADSVFNKEGVHWNFLWLLWHVGGSSWTCCATQDLWMLKDPTIDHCMFACRHRFMEQRKAKGWHFEDRLCTSHVSRPWPVWIAWCCLQTCFPSVRLQLTVLGFHLVQPMMKVRKLEDQDKNSHKQMTQFPYRSWNWIIQRMEKIAAP